ncbi:MAG: hypothetical protein ACE5IZ_06200 [Dehalococcoidia bacterium]
MTKLKVFVEDGCGLCAESVRLVEVCRQMYPRLTVEIVDVARDGSAKPEEVFAVPTFMLDGRVLSLGNPNPATLTSAISEALAGEESCPAT